MIGPTSELRSEGAEEPSDGTAIKTQRLLLLTGIPGTGKTEMGRFLEREHGFVHIDVEEMLLTPPPKTHRDILFSAIAHKTYGSDVVITWGFLPGQDEPTIRALQGQGFQIVWFEGDHQAAHRAFKRRGTVPLRLFHGQIERIKLLDIDSFRPHRLNPFENGEFLAREVIAKRLLELQ